MLLFASICEIDGEIFLILIFGFGLITFYEIRSQYILSRDRPCPYAPTNSALIKASAEILAWVIERPKF